MESDNQEYIHKKCEDSVKKKSPILCNLLEIGKLTRE